MKRYLILLVGVTSISLSFAAPNPKYLTYIELWKQTALQQQKDYGIPASITMAQALLESAAGTSELAVNANNHFGIKCAEEWMGDVYRYDDDARGECFRVYGDAAESFIDHSLFLRRPRYLTLYDIPTWDYAGWARRLKECGYATDPLYASKLIKIIEDYDLASLDGTGVPPTNEDPDSIAAPMQQGGKAVMVVATAPIASFAANPEPEYVEPLTAKEEKENFFLSHAKKKQNGVAYVVAKEGDTYANVAFRLDVTERSLRVWNDALGRDLQEGDRIYLAQKRAHAPKDRPTVWVRPGDSVWRIAQWEGVQVDELLKINGLSPQIRTFRTGQQILLRPVKD